MERWKEKNARFVKSLLVAIKFVALWSAMQNISHIIRPALCVAKNFTMQKSNDTVCCSPKCSKKHRQDLYKQGVNKAATDKMVAARYSNPKLMPSPENINAKSWIIQSPDGTIYKCRNLKNWLREHEYLLDGRTLRGCVD